MMSPQEEIDNPLRTADPIDLADAGSATPSGRIAEAEPETETSHEPARPNSYFGDVADADSLVAEHANPANELEIDSPGPMIEATTAASGQQPSAKLTDDLTSTGLVAAVHSLEDSVSRRLDSLQKSFDRELRAEATRDRIVERLHSELQDYKQDFLLKVQRPIFVDLIQLHDDLGKMIEAPSIGATDTDQTSHLVMTLQSIQTAIEDILYRQGVEPFSIEGNAFDPRQQRAVTTQATNDPLLNKLIATRLRKGFRAGDKLIRPEIVTVFIYRPAP